MKFAHVLCQGEGGEQEGVTGVNLYRFEVFPGEGRKYGGSQVWRSAIGRDHCGQMKMVVGY